MTEVIELSPVLDLVAATDLLNVFFEKRGHDLEVEACHVRRLGAQCLQILLSAKATWVEDGCRFEVKDHSEEFIEYLRIMGLHPEDLNSHLENIG